MSAAPVPATRRQRRAATRPEPVGPAALSIAEPVETPAVTCHRPTRLQYAFLAFAAVVATLLVSAALT